MAEREVRLARAKWIGPNKIRLRFDPFAYRYIRLKVLERDGYVCYWCGDPGDTMDHVIPWSKGGRTTMDNCICACQECNGQRGDMPAEKFAHIRNVPPPRVVVKTLEAPILKVLHAPVLKAPEVPAAKAPEAPANKAPEAAAKKARAATPALVAVARPYALMDLLDPFAPPVSRRRLS